MPKIKDKKLKNILDKPLKLNGRLSDKKSGLDQLVDKKSTKDAQKDGARLLYQEIKFPHPGESMGGRVIEVTKKAVYLDLGVYGIGVVRGRELWEAPDVFSKLKVGDKVAANLLEIENEEGQMELSFKHATRGQAWDDLKQKLEKGEVLTVKIKEANKGGLISMINGIMAFLPVSQLNSKHYPRVEGGDQSLILSELKKFIGKELSVKIITADDREEKLIISEKKVESKKLEERVSKLKEGDVVEGEVSGIVDFGVFIKFDSLEGLVHISELAWQLIEDPRDIVKVGDKIKAEIIGIEGDKVSLSMKRLKKDPWINAVKKYKIGQVVEGEITKINPFGVFVQLDENIHGLAHISEISSKKINRPDEVVSVGEKYKFKILSIEPEDHRLGLSLRALEEDSKKKTKTK